MSQCVFHQLYNVAACLLWYYCITTLQCSDFYMACTMNERHVYSRDQLLMGRRPLCRRSAFFVKEYFPVGIC